MVRTQRRADDISAMVEGPPRRRGELASLDGSNPQAASTPNSVVYTDDSGTTLPSGGVACGSTQSISGTRETELPSRSPVPASADHHRPTGQQTSDRPSPQEAPPTCLDRSDEGARVLYYAFNQGGYSPRWATAPNKTAWRNAARALIRAVDDGII